MSHMSIKEGLCGCTLLTASGKYCAERSTCIILASSLTGIAVCGVIMSILVLQCLIARTYIQDVNDPQFAHLREPTIMSPSLAQSSKHYHNAETASLAPYLTRPSDLDTRTTNVEPTLDNVIRDPEEGGFSRAGSNVATNKYDQS